MMLSADDDAPRAEGLRGVSIGGEIARAKINLTLEILGRRPDGYHELRSLVTFADYGDTLRLEDPTVPFSLRIDGPFASALEGGNLVQAAAELYARLMSETSGAGRPSFWPHSPITTDDAAIAAYHDAGLTPSQTRAARAEQRLGDGARGNETSTPGIRDHDAPPLGAFHLTKRIPVAAGLGGGSADAAAALQLLSRLAPHPQPLEALMRLAAKLGADVPVCLLSKPAIMTGIGERLTLLPCFPRIPAVLVNPRMPLATAAVFRELRAAPLEAAAAAHEAEAVSLHDVEALVNYAKRRRNDLEAPARRLLPAISVILDRLEQIPGAVLVRLSGSGPTCFALFRQWDEAAAAAEMLRSEQAGWWIEVTTLG